MALSLAETTSLLAVLNDESSPLENLLATFTSTFERHRHFTVCCSIVMLLDVNVFFSPVDVRPSRSVFSSSVVKVNCTPLLRARHGIRDGVYVGSIIGRASRVRLMKAHAAVCLGVGFLVSQGFCTLVPCCSRSPSLQLL